jgi:hypothetical protein
MEDVAYNRRRADMERVLFPALALLMALAFPSGAAAVPPAASFSAAPLSPFTLETVTFTSTSTGSVTSLAWDLDNDGFYDDGTTASASKSFPTAGTYTVRLRVVGPGGSGEQSQFVVIANRPPAAAMVQFPQAPVTDDPVSFVSTSRDPDGALVSQAWDLDDDGAFDDGNGAQASFSFHTPGQYTVRLRVIDRDRAESVAVLLVQVAPRPPEFLNPFPVVRVVGEVTPHGTLITRLTVSAPSGSRVEVRCRGRGCRKHRQVRIAKARRGPQALATRLLRFRRFEARLLRPGAVLEVFVTKRGTIGKYLRLGMRVGKQPRRRDLCIFPGAKRPRSCRS